jgi:hypothetical protein
MEGGMEMTRWHDPTAHTAAGCARKRGPLGLGNLLCLWESEDGMASLHLVPGVGSSRNLTRALGWIEDTSSQVIT